MRPISTPPSVSKYLVVLLVVIPLFIVGCTKEEPAAPVSVAPLPSKVDPLDRPKTLAVAPSATVIVTNFLEATLKGDHATLRTLLTPAARQKAMEKALPFAPQACETAKFTVDRAVPEGKIGAYVHSTLHNVDEMGRRESAEIVWIVALCEEGWRIAGAAVSLFEGQEKTVINFEDPEAALQAIADAEKKEIRRRREAEHIRQARFSTDSY